MDLEPGEEDISAETNEDGDSDGHRARTLIFLVAAGFVIVGALSLTAYWLKCRRQHEAISVWHVLSNSIPLLIGIVIIIMSRALSRAIEEYLDE